LVVEGVQALCFVARLGDMAFQRSDALLLVLVRVVVAAGGEQGGGQGNEGEGRGMMLHGSPFAGLGLLKQTRTASAMRRVIGRRPLSRSRAWWSSFISAGDKAEAGQG
jgi:hypothetical protein